MHKGCMSLDSVKSCMVKNQSFEHMNGANDVCPERQEVPANSDQSMVPYSSHAVALSAVHVRLRTLPVNRPCA